MSKVFKVEAATFISLWDLEGCDVVRDLDLELTYGDGLTLYPVGDVVEEVRSHSCESVALLVKSLQEVRELFGENFLIGF